jgi:hypothetical protein
LSPPSEPKMTHLLPQNRQRNANNGVTRVSTRSTETGPK